MGRARGDRRSWPGTFIRLAGCLGLLVVVFAAGILTGRHWNRIQVVTGLVKPQAGKEAARESTAAAPAARAATALPTLTFYQELTAPLSSPPPRTDPARSATRAAVGGGFTVQLGAYRKRAQADALRASLGRRGIEAEVSEVSASGVTLYRVRSGSFPSRASAEAAAGRLAEETGLRTLAAAR